MAVLEIGINLGVKNLVGINYYPALDKEFDQETRAKFLAGLKDYLSEVYDDKINVISFSNFQIVCYNKMIPIADNLSEPTQPLLSFAVIEKDTDPMLVKQHLKKISLCFRDQFKPETILRNNPDSFKSFIPQIDKILGDLRLKIGDRISSLFGK